MTGSWAEVFEAQTESYLPILGSVLGLALVGLAARTIARLTWYLRIIACLAVMLATYVIVTASAPETYPELQELLVYLAMLAIILITATIIHFGIRYRFTRLKALMLLTLGSVLGSAVVCLIGLFIFRPTGGVDIILASVIIGTP
ncbi:MAG: hypothetical protein QHH07_07405, partial [Sedimentisphaerales bacterium]|nr:hypothetical protein [Sedimentisphaerales bacterium]